ncbi:hypothetical protein KIN20_001627 [Parelaphostrongylus tenuis]|uniref:Uncharacterized protein n=1 Tax=Parelaphostrongylus tenuis TaxID=148309 RepID=A0AAD5LWF1_PARTN|nr:hypothetical protein KIN20_001627 [Parelaphostrongylus tenuis]
MVGDICGALDIPRDPVDKGSRTTKAAEVHQKRVIEQHRRVRGARPIFETVQVVVNKLTL